MNNEQVMIMAVTLGGSVPQIAYSGEAAAFPVFGGKIG